MEKARFDRGQRQRMAVTQGVSAKPLWLIIVSALTLLNMTAAEALGQPEPPEVLTVPPREQGAAPKFVDDLQRVELPKNDPTLKAIRDRAPFPQERENPEEFLAIAKIVLFAKSLPVTPEDLLDLRARRNVAYEDLIDDDQRPNNLFDPLNVKGKLVRSSARVAPDALWEAGIKQLYDGWIEVENSPNKLVYVVFSELPKGMAVSETLTYKVEANGFFVKLMEYTVEKDIGGKVEKVQKFAPLLLGRTLRLMEDEALPVPAVETEEGRVRLNRKDADWAHVLDERPLPVRDENPEEYRLYNQVVAHAHDQPPGLLAKYAVKDFFFGDLLSERRSQYLRDLIHVEGTLVRLRRLEATGRLQATSSIKDVYEGWLVHESHEDHLFCLLFTELPEGMTVPDKGKINARVSFDGYYFKLLGYETKEKDKQDRNVWRKAPLLIGRSPVRLGEDSLWSLANPLIPALLVVFGLVAVAMICLMVWFRHGDRKVLGNAHEAITKVNPFDAKAEPPPGPPAVEPGNAWNRLQNSPEN